MMYRACPPYLPTRRSGRRCRPIAPCQGTVVGGQRQVHPFGELNELPARDGFPVGALYSLVDAIGAFLYILDHCLVNVPNDQPRQGCWQCSRSTVLTPPQESTNNVIQLTYHSPSFAISISCWLLYPCNGCPSLHSPRNQSKRHISASTESEERLARLSRTRSRITEKPRSTKTVVGWK